MSDGGGNRAVVTGIGLRTPLGEAESLWSELLSGSSAARAWSDLDGYPINVACRIPGDVGDPDPTRRGRALAISAAHEALAAANLDLTSGGRRVGVYVGTTMGESAGYEAAAEDGHVATAEFTGNVFANEIATALGLDGPRRTYGTACAAGNYAIGAAADAVKVGEVDVALAGGVEPFSRIALIGFSRMRAMATEMCRPFDVDRRGMQIGEASALLVLEREDDALARGARPLAAVAGWGLSGDAFHSTKPRPDGSGMAQAMFAGLRSAGRSPGEIGWISAHGTGTRASDSAEAIALHAVFGEHPPPVSSIKGALGHSLGAATAVEAAVSVLAIQHRVLPPNANLIAVDPSLDLDVVAEPRHAYDLDVVMSCGFAFGGLNSTLLMERP